MRAAGILLVFCLFSSIFSTVTSLKCQKCVSLGKDCGSLDTKVVECKEDEEFCSNIVGNSTTTNTSVNFNVKDCSTHENCLEGLYVTTTVDGNFEISRASCCQTDGCNTEPVPLEKYDELQPNGLQCPGCYSLDENYCKANQTVNCVGEEDQCVTLTSTTGASGNYTAKSSYQGCTTKNSCSIPLGLLKIASGEAPPSTITRECRNASSSEPDLQ